MRFARISCGGVARDLKRAPPSVAPPTPSVTIFNHRYHRVDSGISVFRKSGEGPCTAASWWVLSLFSLMVFCLPAEALGRQGATIHGRVTEAATSAGRGAPVGAALIELVPVEGGAARHAMSSADDGSYRLGEIPAGAYRLQVQRIGFELLTLELRLSPGEVRRLDLELRARAFAVEGVVVEGERAESRERVRFQTEAGVTARVVSSMEMKRLPGLAEADVLRAIEVLPGVVTTSDFSSAFNVRGGSADQNLILLDGFPVFNPFHLGGLFSVFNADILSGAELLAGGFGAEYGGRASSVLNVETKEFTGTDFGGEAGVSLLASRLSLHGGLPFAPHRGGWFLSARRSYFDKIIPPDEGLPYHLVDLQGGLTVSLPGAGRLRLVAYAGDDILDMSKRESKRTEEGDADVRLAWDWGNDLLGLRWDQPWGEWISTAWLGVSRYTENFGLVDFDGLNYSSRASGSTSGRPPTPPSSISRRGSRPSASSAPGVMPRSRSPSAATRSSCTPSRTRRSPSPTTCGSWLGPISPRWSRTRSSSGSRSSGASGGRRRWRRITGSFGASSSSTPRTMSTIRTTIT